MTTASTRGGGPRKGAAPSPRSWEERIDDPTEPLFTMGIAADLLGTDDQTLRRLEGALDRSSARPSGNQRRYSRNDLVSFDAALALAREGHPPQSVARIMELQGAIEALARPD